MVQVIQQGFALYFETAKVSPLLIKVVNISKFHFIINLDLRAKRLLRPKQISLHYCLACYRNATSTTSTQTEIMRNMRYISELRRKIRRLEQEDAELKQRLNMILVIYLSLSSKCFYSSSIWRLK